MEGLCLLFVLFCQWSCLSTPFLIAFPFSNPSHKTQHGDSLLCLVWMPMLIAWGERRCVHMRNKTCREGIFSCWILSCWNIPSFAETLIYLLKTQTKRRTKLTHIRLTEIDTSYLQTWTEDCDSQCVWSGTKGESCSSAWDTGKWVLFLSGS